MGILESQEIVNSTVLASIDMAERMTEKPSQDRRHQMDFQSVGQPGLCEHHGERDDPLKNVLAEKRRF